jgi:hypothetical protein
VLNFYLLEIKVDIFSPEKPPSITVLAGFKLMELAFSQSQHITAKFSSIVTGNLTSELKIYSGKATVAYVLMHN